MTSPLISVSNDTPKIEIKPTTGNDLKTQKEILCEAINAAENYVRCHLTEIQHDMILVPVRVGTIRIMWIHVVVVEPQVLSGRLGFISHASATKKFLNAYVDSSIKNTDLHPKNPYDILLHLVANSRFRLQTRSLVPARITSYDFMENIIIKNGEDFGLTSMSVCTSHGPDDIRSIKLMRLCKRLPQKPSFITESASTMIHDISNCSKFGIATNITGMEDVSEVVYSNMKSLRGPEKCGFTMDGFIKLISTTKLEKIAIHDCHDTWRNVDFHSRKFEDKLIAAGGPSKSLKEIVCTCQSPGSARPDLTMIVDYYTYMTSHKACAATVSRIGYKFGYNALALGLTQSIELGSDSPFHYLGCCIIGIMELMIPDRVVKISRLEWSVLGNKIVNDPALLPDECTLIALPKKRNANQPDEMIYYDEISRTVIDFTAGIYIQEYNGKKYGYHEWHEGSEFDRVLKESGLFAIP